MKHIIFKTIVASFIIILNVNTLHSQSLKKAFKAFYDGSYTYADMIFKTSEHKNTCIGLYGQALVQYTMPFAPSNVLTEERKEKELIKKMKDAYSKILTAETLTSQLSDKDLKSIQDYFTTDSISCLKNRLENYFLGLKSGTVDQYFLGEMKLITKGNELYQKLENLYLNNEFEEIKNENTNKTKISKAENLIKKFPENKIVKVLNRFNDSIRFAEATTIRKLSILMNEYPDNEFTDEIFKKIKSINNAFQKEIENKDSEHKKIIVSAETNSEEDAIKIISDRYYDLYKKSYWSVPHEMYYMKLTDEMLKKFNLQKKYLVYTYHKLQDYNYLANEVYSANTKYPNSYGLNLHDGTQVFSRDKVFKNGKQLTSYTAIAVMLNGRWRYRDDEVTQTMQEIIEELKKQNHQVITYSSVGPVKIYPKDNPFPFYYDPEEVEGFDYNKNSISLLFLSDYKEPYLFEIDPEKIDEALKRIMYKIGFYFRD